MKRCEYLFQGFPAPLLGTLGLGVEKNARDELVVEVAAGGPPVMVFNSKLFPVARRS